MKTYIYINFSTVCSFCRHVMEGLIDCLKKEEAFNEATHGGMRLILASWHIMDSVLKTM